MMYLSRMPRLDYLSIPTLATGHPFEELNAIKIKTYGTFKDDLGFDYKIMKPLEKIIKTQINTSDISQGIKLTLKDT